MIFYKPFCALISEFLIVVACLQPSTVAHIHPPQTPLPALCFCTEVHMTGTYALLLKLGHVRVTRVRNLHTSRRHTHACKIALEV